MRNANFQSCPSLVENPLTIKLKDLVAEYDQITCPVTLVCAGNRRKEQNVVRKTKGFSWGAAGVSNALWTGVMMHEILKKAGLKRGARYICMEGADKLVSRVCIIEFYLSSDQKQYSQMDIMELRSS
jgi:DMSO/TMAO reductase YedYZ molybdopterin-dependent catalytic subunit